MDKTTEALARYASSVRYEGLSAATLLARSATSSIRSALRWAAIAANRRISRGVLRARTAGRPVRAFSVTARAHPFRWRHSRTR